MKCLIVAIALFSLLEFIPAFAGETSTQVSSVQAQLQSIYDATDLAGTKLDLNGMLAYCDPTCEFVSVQNVADSLQAMRRDFHMLFKFESVKSLDCTTKIQSITRQGNGLVVIVKEHLNLLGTDPVDGTKLIESDDYICRDYWRETDKGWRRLRTKVISGQTYESGQLTSGEPTDDHW